MSAAPKGLLGSSAAAIASQLWRFVLVFATHLVLRRLVDPADWGLWYWCEPFFIILGVVRDLGLPTHLMRLTPRPYRNLLKLELVMGAGLAAVVVLAAPLLTYAYADAGPDFVPVVRVLTLLTLIEGLAYVPMVYFEAELRVRRALIPEALRSLCYATVALSLGLTGFGVWSMVLGSVSGAVVYALTMWSRAWGNIPLEPTPEPMRVLVRASAPLAAVWGLLLLRGWIDPVVLGALFDRDTVGLYGFTLYIAYLVSRLLAVPIARALYPAFVALRHDRDRMFEAYRLGTLLMLALEVPVALFVFLNADTVLALLGGDKWRAGAGFLRLLCFAPLADPFSRFGGDLLVARGEERLWILSLAASILSVASAGLVFSGWLGPAGMAWANSLPAGALVAGYGVARVSPAGFRGLVRDLVLVYLLPVPLFLGAVALAGGGAPVARFAASLVALGIAVGAQGLRFAAPFRVFFADAETKAQPATKT